MSMSLAPALCDSAVNAAPGLGGASHSSPRSEAERLFEAFALEAESDRHRLNALLASIPVTIWEVVGEPAPANPAVTFIGSHIQTLLGYSADEWVRNPALWFEAIHPDDQSRVLEAAKSEYRSGSRNTCQYRYVAKDGQIVPVELKLVVDRDERGRARSMRGIVIDITERVGRLNAEANFRCLVEQSLIGVCIIQDGKFQYINPKGAALTGYSVEELLAMNALDIVPPSHRAEVGEKIQRWLKGEITDNFYTTPFQKKDVTIGLLEVHGTRIDFRGRPATLSSVLDVTERSELERDVEELARNQQLLLDSTAEGIVAIDLDGRCTMVNRAAVELLKYSSSDLLGQKIHETIHGKRADGTVLREEESPILQSLRTGTATRVHDDVLWNSDEVPISVSYSASPIYDGRTLKGVVVAFSDITERKLLEAQLERANRLSSLGRLSATVAHEFNNVLMGIQPYTDLIRRSCTTAEIARATDQIASSVQRGKKVTLEILRYTQPAEPAIDAINVRQWLPAVAWNLKNVLPAGITFELFLPEDELPLYVAGDAAQLEQVLTNLVFNARDAMPDGGKLAIGVTHCQSGSAFRFGVVNTPDQFAHFNIRDTGTGMSAETMRHIFEPLFTTKKSGGTGLGLAVAHQIVSRHRGQMFVESWPEVGTNFHIFLPVTLPQLVHSKPAPMAEPVTVKRLLMVEDDPAVSDGLSALLESEALEVEIVRTGGEAMAAVERFKPEVVLLDIGLPDMDGMEVYRQIAASWPKLPVVFSTGHGDEQKLQSDLSRSGVRFLLKPYDFATLLKTLREIS